MKLDDVKSLYPPNDLLELIRTRRSIRKFTSEPVPDHVVEAMLEAGIWAPSACNQQVVRFVFLRKKADLRILNMCKMNIANPQAAILVVLDLGSAWYQKWYNDPHTKQNPILDVGAAVQNMLLVAHAYGLASCWVSFSPYLNYQGYETFFRRFRFPDTCRITSALFVGYPAEAVAVNKHTHHGRLIMRRPVNEYKVELLPRILLLGAHDPDFDNLGSQAMTNGMMRLIEDEFPGSDHAVLEYPWNAPWSNFPTYKQLEALPDAQRLNTFFAEVNLLVLLGQMLRDERESETRENMFLQAKRTARMIVGAIRQQPNRPKYNARLNDPLEVGRCPTLPELPEGGVRREDGWIAPSVQPRFPRLLKRQYGSWITQHFTSLPTRLLTWLLKRQLKTIAEQYLARLSFLSWADIVFCDGDGAFADQWDWSRNHVIKVLAEWLAAKRLGANVFIVNQTVALNTPWLKTLAAYVYNEMDGIVVREPLSRKELIDMGVRPEIIFLGADAATWADYKEGLAWQDKGLKIIPDDIAGGLGLFIRGDMGEDVQVWADLVRNMHQLYGRPIVFVPSSKSEDSDFAHAIAQNSPLVVLDEVKHFDQAFSVLQHLSIVISSRYHPVYFSILAGVPFIAIRGNTFKTRGLQQLIEYPLTVIEESSDFQSQIMRHVQTILENYNEFQQLILARREKLRQLAVLNARVAEETSVYSFWINQLRLKRKRSGQN